MLEKATSTIWQHFDIDDMENFFLKGQPAASDNMAEKTDIQTLRASFPPRP